MIWSEVGERIRKIRQDKNLSQEQFGTLIGISRRNVSNIERGQKFSIEMLETICEKMNVTFEYVLYGHEITDISESINFLDDFSLSQIQLSIDIIKKFSDLIMSPNWNRLLISELMRRYATIATQATIV